MNTQDSDLVSDDLAKPTCDGQQEEFGLPWEYLKNASEDLPPADIEPYENRVLDNLWVVGWKCKVSLKSLLEVSESDRDCRSLQSLTTNEYRQILRKFLCWAIKRSHLCGTSTPKTDEDILSPLRLFDEYDNGDGDEVDVSLRRDFFETVLARFLCQCREFDCNIQQMLKLLNSNRVREAINGLTTKKARTFTQRFLTEAFKKEWLDPTSVPETARTTSEALDALREYHKLKSAPGGC
jgi:hypothetical protein